LKDKAIKLTLEQLHALVRYHLKRDQVIIMQQEVAEVLRQSVDSEFHSHFDLPHNSSSTTDVQGPIYIKVLMETYYDLGPGASSIQYKYVQEIISNFGKGEKDKHFDIRKFAKDIQQASGAYKLVHDLTSGPREVIKPEQEILKECLQHTQASFNTMRYKAGILRRG
jgi:hypothetical protein